MPRGDGTGPMGNGPRAGWGAGSCSDNPGPADMNQMPGRGFGRGSGRGRGRGNGMGRWRCAGESGSVVQPNPEEEHRSLENHKEALQARLEDINRRLDELKVQEPLEK